ncbi:toprim domain-containing protein [Candidatus Thiothrix sp. Deng01]|uniref:Toprim domain-containing protein n=1 Tax=Candidatus Thiothrix phosphatis TaxID=3112415 RepID=A0ABU6CWL7_9GAMM|nr:toprim domain-containing protein [Candidatus Thiothrix sp. Deng01]MEB4591235.1 toprim domain-containing protein [Candidatus Thiothrix sp. Deng01]
MMTLQQHMLENIGVSIDNPVIDGTWHNGRGKGRDKVGYVGHYLPKGLLIRYHNHKTDEIHVWKEWDGGQGEYIDPLEYRRKREEAQAKADAAAQQAERERLALLAILQTVITESVPASHDLPYPLGKRILALAARQATKRYELVPATAESRAQYITPDDLLIPVYSHTGALQGIQQITSTGYKLMRGTFKDGLLWIGGGLSTGETPNRLYIAEGWATGVAVHMRTRNPVVVAFATSNLLAAGKWARDRWENAEIVFAVDNDLGSKIRVGGREIENPGKHYAERAALAVNAAVVTPPGNEKSDWNDWHTAQIAGKKIPDLL